MPDRHDRGWERLLDEALMTSEFAWWEWEIPANRVVSNDKKVEMLGRRPEDFRNAGYQAYTDLLHPEDYERTMQAMRDHLEGRAPLYQIDYRILRADGTYTWFMDRGRIIESGPKGEPLRLRGIVIDLGPEIEGRVEDEAFAAAFREALPPAGGGGERHAVICSGCRRLKIGGCDWMSVDVSFHKALSGEISHGLCADCIGKLYPEEAKRLFGGDKEE